MLKVFRKNRKSIGVVILIACVAMVMTGFGIEQAFDVQSARQAMSIGETKVTYDEFYSKKRELEENYRRMLGANYYQLAKALNINTAQQTVEKIIAETLIGEASHERGLRSGDGEVRNAIVGIFGGEDKFDPAMYDSYLRQRGVTARQFEAEVRQDLRRFQFQELLTDVSFATERETKSALEHAESAYRVAYVELAPSTFEAKLEEPGAEALQSYYDGHATEYETPPMASYDFLVVSPEDVLSTIEVLPEDLELYYSENQNKFKAPERLKARHIQMNFAPQATPAQMAELKEKAKEVHAKAQAGESFDLLALQHSDDITTKTLGGDLGWISRGKMAKEFDQAAFDLKGPGLADLVSTNYGFHIVKVEEYQPERVRPFDEVKEEVERAIRMQEAPAYASAKAQDLEDEWEKSGLSLSEFAGKKGFEARSSGKALPAEQDPEGAPRGLSAKVLTFPNEKKQLIELGESTILAQINEFLAPDIPPLANIREKVVADYKKDEARRLAKETAQKIVEEIRAKAHTDLAAAAAAHGLTIQEKADLKPSKQEKSGPFADPKVQDYVFSAYTARPADKVLEVGGSYFVTEVREIVKPAPQTIAEKLTTAREQETRELGQLAVEASLNRLKSKTAIDFDENLIAQDLVDDA